MKKEKSILGFIAAFWFSSVTRTDFRDVAEYSGRKKFSRKIFSAK